MRKLHVELAIDHDELTYDQICSEIEQHGDFGWSAGDPIRDISLRSARSYIFSRWSLAEISNEPNDLPGVLNILVDRSRPALKNIRSLSVEAGARAQLIIQIDETNDVIGFGVPRDILEFVNFIGASMEISIVVHGSSELR